jgi:hypothetical protein
MPTSFDQRTNRRGFLKAGAITAALPWLESVGSQAAFATASTTLPPQRFLTLFFPNGVYPSAWQASQTNDGLKLGGSLAPLQGFADRGIVLSNVDHPLGGHLGQTAGFLSGRDFNPNENGTIVAAESLDQMLAKHWADETFVPSLNLALEPPSQGAFGNRPRSYGNSISWSSPTSKIEPQVNPQLAFDQVFFGQTAAGRQAATRRRRIVDAIYGQAINLRNRVSRFDQTKLDQYLDSIRDLEAKLEKTIHPDEPSWVPPTSPERIRPTDSGIPSSYEKHLDLMLDILVLALQTDSTRVGTLVMGHSISRVVYDFVDQKIKRNHHDLSHHRNDPKKIADYNKVTTWFAKKTAEMLAKMDAVDEGNGSLLDNSIVLYGSGMKDGNVHDGVNVPIALFGGGRGVLKTGRHIECPQDTILAQLHLSLLQRYGVKQDDFNGVTSQTINTL